MDEYNTITVEEAARALRVHPRTIRRICERGELRAIRVGRQWRIDRASFEEYYRGQDRKKVDELVCVA